MRGAAQLTLNPLGVNLNRGMMRVIVFGGSGKTGQEIVRTASMRGAQVTVFSRTAADNSLESNVNVIRGNVADLDAVTAAVAGHDAVISALGVSKPLAHDPDVVLGVGHIVRAMEKHNVRRLIYLSFIGVRESRNSVGFILRYVAPIPLRHEIADHEAKEAIIRTSALDWTIVRPPKLTSGKSSEAYRVGLDISTRKPIPMMSRKDVANFIAQELYEPQYIHAAPRLLH